MEELLCSIEFMVTDDGIYVVRLRSPLGGVREYKGSSFDEVLDDVMIEIQQEFEGVF
jgi:hypothetical protein